LESLDAGTRESYTKIKGKDVFDTVVENIRRYAANSGNIQLKYIVMPENCNDDDLNGFLAICGEIKPMKIRISCDIHNDFNILPQQIIDFAIKLGQQAIKRGHEVLVLEHFGAKNDKYIQQQIFSC
jgi:molybdenum cofactor biosynthesis enzyme MoaA